MDAEGGSNSIRPLALKALAERLMLLSGSLHMAQSEQHPALCLIQGQLSHSPVLEQLLEPQGSSQKSSSTAVQRHNCNRDELSLPGRFSDLIVLLSNIRFFSVC